MSGGFYNRDYECPHKLLEVLVEHANALDTVKLTNPLGAAGAGYLVSGWGHAGIDSYYKRDDGWYFPDGVWKFGLENGWIDTYGYTPDQLVNGSAYDPTKAYWEIIPNEYVVTLSGGSIPEISSYGCTYDESLMPNTLTAGMDGGMYPIGWPGFLIKAPFLNSGAMGDTQILDAKLEVKSYADSTYTKTTHHMRYARDITDYDRWNVTTRAVAPDVETKTDLVPIGWAVVGKDNTGNWTPLGYTAPSADTLTFGKTQVIDCIGLARLLLKAKDSRFSELAVLPVATSQASGDLEDFNIADDAAKGLIITMATGMTSISVIEDHLDEPFGSEYQLVDIVAEGYTMSKALEFGNMVITYQLPSGVVARFVSYGNYPSLAVRA